MPLGESLADWSRKRFFPIFVESLRNGDLQRARSAARFMTLEIGSDLSYPYEAEDETAQSAIREAKRILREARDEEEC